MARAAFGVPQSNSGPVRHLRLLYFSGSPPSYLPFKCTKNTDQMDHIPNYGTNLITFKRIYKIELN
jgi:hypothetical protein